MLIFVYGTLQRGQSNHGCMEGAEYVQDAITRPWYQLWAPRQGGYPFMTTGTREVCGEVYEVPAEVLVRLDMLEGHPDAYERKLIGVHGLEGVQAYVYPRQPRVPRWEHENEGVLEWPANGSTTTTTGLNL